VTVRTIVSLVIALLKLANSIYGWLHDSALIKEGEDRQVAKAPCRDGCPVNDVA
jgi:hypothetical protein